MRRHWTDGLRAGAIRAELAAREREDMARARELRDADALNAIAAAKASQDARPEEMDAECPEWTPREMNDETAADGSKRWI